MNGEEIIEENERRKAKYTAVYDQIAGISDVIPRRRLNLKETGEWFIPEDMFHIPWIKTLARYDSVRLFAKRVYSIKNLKIDEEEKVTGIYIDLLRTRLKYDFEFFAASCVKIKHKVTGLDVPFLLNYPQRTLLKELERQRLAGQPIRIILLKARQWGGSTLTQIYMAWIQLFRKTGWNSVIAAHLKDASANIKGMYSKLLENLPSWCSDEMPEFTPFQRMANTSIIGSVNCKVTIGSSETPNSVRSSDLTMAHLSEVAYWKDTKEKKATDLVRSITSSILPVEESIIVLESTANGVGDYFHTEYINAKNKVSDKTALFIPWYDIEIYRLPLKENAFEFYSSFNDYEKYLWDSGATLEAIKWYRAKRKEYQQDSDMQSEYPTDDVEAFTFSGETVFERNSIELLRKHCEPPAFTGDMVSKTGKTTGRESLADVDFASKKTGLLKIWIKPDKDSEVSSRYLTVVDVGGRSKKADYSVILVLDRYWMIYGGTPEVVAQWHGHCDHDILVWKSAQISKYYNNALLVIESNTLETEDTDGDHTEYILSQLGGTYPNLYSRTPADKIREGVPVRWGFHTNRATKTMIIDNMIHLLRESPYIERCQEACNEYDTYEKKENGAFGAIEGHHDDLLMTRLIGMYVAYEMPLPKEQKPRDANARPIWKQRIVSEASI